MKGEQFVERSGVVEQHHGNGHVKEVPAISEHFVVADNLHWLFSLATPEQRTYIGAKLQFDRVVAERDRLLAPIDLGEREMLTMAEQEALEHLQPIHDTASRVLLTAELPLLAFAQDWLCRRPGIVERYPRYTLLLDHPAPAHREVALMLAAWLGFEKDEG